MNVLTIWIYLSFLAFTGWCQTIDDARALTTDLLANYSRILRPKRNQSEAVDVYMDIELITIQDFDEVQETLSITAIILMYWTDELMVWKPEDYGGIDEVKFESDQVWTPMLVLLNNVEKLEKLGFDEAWLMVRYTSNGTAMFYPGGVLSSKCDVDVTYFPWDKHKCLLQFSTWGFEPKHMTVTPRFDQMFRTFYSPNGAWTYVSSGFLPLAQYHTMDAYIVLERQPRFVVVNVITPIVLLAILSSLVFYIPVESGERISYSITMLLAISVFLTLVGDNLPKTSNPMSFFSYYLISILSLDILITLANMFSLRIYYRDEREPITSCWKSLTRCLQSNWKKTWKRQYKDKEYIQSEQYTQRKERMNHRPRNDIIYDVVRFPGVYGSARANTRCHYKDGKRLEKNHVGSHVQHSSFPLPLSKAAGPAEIDDISHDEDITWKDVSMAVDKVCFVGMFLLEFGLTFVFVLVIWTGGESDL